MTAPRIIDQYSPRERVIAAAIYGAVLVGIIATAAGSLASLADSYEATAAAEARLAQLEGRRPATRAGSAETAPEPPKGSPFLEGDTVTVAGAALLQRVGGALGRVGGVVLSSQVELQPAQSEVGRVGLVITGEMDQAALQDFLYDIEGGMPFVFVDQIVIQAAGSQGPEIGRVRVLITVSSQWRSTR